MTIAEFRATLGASAPPKLTPHLRALWHAGRDEWHLAHDLVQDLPDANASWIHAYLHRVEGDLGNARYWYQRAGKPFCKLSLEAEWSEIAGELLKVK